MLDLLFEVLIYTIPQSTGRLLVYLATFGQVRCEDGLAEVIGVIFWIAVAILVFFLIKH